MLRSASLTRWRGVLAAGLLVSAVAAAPAGAQKVTTPKEFFGHNIGDDYWLPNYTQFVGYWQKLARESPRAHLDTIGLTAEGRPQLSMIVSSPENIRSMEKYRNMAKSLAYAEIDSATAKRFAKEGKAVVWIDGGLHASEVLGANQLIETSYQMISGTDAETMRILNDVIIVFVHANPDGMELEANWYNQEPDSSRKNLNTPTLYQKYVGHDNNRDFYIANQNESTNMNRWMYLTWFPQIMYNHHQTGPAGAVMFSPPFRDPANYFFHESIITGIDVVGAAIHARMEMEHKPGVVDRSMSSYSTWWNGGLRTMAYFHNMIGILTETIGNPTPMTIPFLPERQLRFADMPYPIEPFQTWHFRQSIDYSVTANKAILDLASRYRETYLWNIYRMGRDEIERGSEDSWIVTPSKLAEAEQKIGGGRGGRGGRGNAPLDAFANADFGGRGQGGPTKAQYTDNFRNPADRMPRGYIIPSNQADFLTAQKFLVALQKAGILMSRATAAFTVGGKQYPAGSYVVKTNQAFRAHVLDMFEPQDHPNDFAYPGAPPTRPYDNAGWTLAMQMGVKFDRILDGFDGPFKALDPLKDRIKPDPTTVASGGAGWVVSDKVNDAFHAVARLWTAGADVYRTSQPVTVAGVSYPAGSYFIPANAKSTPVVQKSAADLGVTFAPTADLTATSTKVPQARVGLWDRYGGSMPSGHIRWLLEQMDMPYKLVYAQELDAGNLRAKYDVLIFPENSIPGLGTGGRGGRGGRGGGGGGGRGGGAAIPAQFQSMVGTVTTERTVPKLKEFVEQGGRLIAIGPSSLNAAEQFGFPVTDHMVERTPTGTEATHLPSDKFYVPGSLLEVAYDTTSLAARGEDAHGVVFFDNSPVLRLGPDAAAKGVKPIAWFDSPEPLKSGWAWGQNYLDGGVAMAEGTYGQGKVFMFGPEITFRAQPHATFKLLFNSIVGDGKANIVP
ncbi:MAG TPA: M14 metallopeptidase family protein [Gemmatimonadaceae bacterium]|nr:M14 metallopeptidase family protein [Gemmatimonadaceae bacterium]